MSKLYRNINKKKRIKNNKYINGQCVCAICGCTNGVVDSADHCVPLALVKWCNSDSNRKEEMLEFINGENNLFYVHKKCNLKKGCVLPSSNDIRRLHVEESVKKEIANFLRSHKSETESFNSIIKECKQRQDNRCYLCTRCIGNSDNVVLRRKFKHKNEEGNVGRNIDNAIVICNTCNSVGKINDIPKYIHRGLLLEIDGHLISPSVNEIIYALERIDGFNIKAFIKSVGLTGIKVDNGKFVFKRY